MFQGFRFDLRQVLVATAILAAALAALQVRSQFVYTGCNFLFGLLVAMAVVGAVCTRQPARAFWCGVASVGLIYGWMLGANPPSLAQRTAFPAVAEWFLHWHDTLRFHTPEVGDTVSALWRGGGYYTATIDAIDPQQGYLMRWQDGSTPHWVQLGQFNYGVPAVSPHPGHSIMAIVMALFGGALARWLFGGPTLTRAQAVEEGPVERQGPY